MKSASELNFLSNRPKNHELLVSGDPGNQPRAGALAHFCSQGYRSRPGCFLERESLLQNCLFFNQRELPLMMLATTIANDA
jgi:hypothetical protein